VKRIGLWDEYDDLGFVDVLLLKNKK
jgi:hypothetical protein